MNISIRKKLTLIFVITVLLILTIFDIIMYLSFKLSLEKNIDESLVNNLAILVREIFDQDISGNLIEEDEEYEEEILFISEIFHEETTELIRPAGQCTQLIDLIKAESPQIIARSENLSEINIPYDQDLLEKTIASKGKQIEYYLIKTDSARIINLYVNDHLGNEFIVQIAEPVNNMLNSLNRIGFLLLVISPLFLIILSFIGYGLIKQAFSPIKSIVNDVESITAKDLSLRIKTISSKDEIGVLIATFNNLISRLENSFNQIKQFSLDVSHELKTPLTVLKGEIEVTLRQKRESADYLNTLKSLREEVEKLQYIVDNLLLLSNLESKEHIITKEIINLNTLLKIVLNDLYPLAKNKNQKIDFFEKADTEIIGEKELLIRLFSNIVENAIKYSHENGEISIKLSENNSKVVVSISDNGIGIEPEYKDKIFDRFFRIDESRTSEPGGSGLGLAIAQKIASLHDAEIKVDSAIGAGSTFHITFPSH